MKITKHIKIVYTVLFIVTTNYLYSTTNSATYFCGGGYYNPNGYYFNLFDQKNISQKAFYPFLRIEDQPFYTDIEPSESENIRLWYHYFDKKYTKQVLSNVIFKGHTNGFLESFKKNEKESRFMKYLAFAKNCEVIALPKSSTWDYNKILNTEEKDIWSLLENGLALFEKEEDKSIKLRYAYQIIRLYHYGKMNLEGITFFEENIKSDFSKNEIYYYILDQIGGCYYNLKKYEKAAYTFLTVFDKSFDRKVSAFTSYKFCTYRGAEGKSLLKNEEEEANQVFITALRQFSDELQDLDEIRDLGAAEDKQELLMMRMVNNLEREYFNHYRLEEKNIMKIDFEAKERIEDLLTFMDTVIAEEPKNKEFWQLTSSYLSFLSGDLNEAKLKVEKVDSNKLTVQKESLKVIYEVFSWDHISDENEKWLAKKFNNYERHCNNEKGEHCNLHGFVFKQLSHYYFKENELAKAFLLHNSIYEIRGISSHVLVDQLIDFVKKPTKSSFEKLLLKSEFDKGFSESFMVSILEEEKGMMYFRSGDFNNALPYFKKEDENEVPPEVFSNNIIECFSCKVSKVMTDKVYRAEFFSFLNKDMNKLSLLTNLKRLDDITQDASEKVWKRKLANYLLANYFFNVSNTGYYRTINYSGEYWYNYNFGEKQLTMDGFISNNENYYFSIFYNSYNDLASKSKNYYRNTIALSEDEELNARCSYMIAKCELNDYYNNVWSYNYGGYDGEEVEKPTREGFDALKTKYNNTSFYIEIKSKCGFFKHYDAQ